MKLSAEERNAAEQLADALIHKARKYETFRSAAIIDTASLKEAGNFILRLLEETKEEAFQKAKSEYLKASSEYQKASKVKLAYAQRLSRELYDFRDAGGPAELVVDALEEYLSHRKEPNG